MTVKSKKEEIREFLESTPKDIELLVKHSMDLASQIINLLKSKKITQRELAEKLGKKESEISKWLSGTHNFTLKTISKIESVLGEQILFTRDEVRQRFLPYLFRRFSRETYGYSNYLFHNINSQSSEFFVCEKIDDESFDNIISDDRREMEPAEGKTATHLSVVSEKENNNCYNNVA